MVLCILKCFVARYGISSPYQFALKFSIHLSLPVPNDIIILAMVSRAFEKTDEKEDEERGRIHYFPGVK